MLLMKECKRCEEVKDTIDFHNNKGSTDGKSDYCKICVKNRQNDGRFKKIASREAERMRAYGRWAADHVEWLENFDKEHGLKGRKGGFLPNDYFEED